MSTAITIVAKVRESFEGLLDDLRDRLVDVEDDFADVIDAIDEFTDKMLAVLDDADRRTELSGDGGE